MVTSPSFLREQRQLDRGHVWWSLVGLADRFATAVGIRISIVSVWVQRLTAKHANNLSLADRGLKRVDASHEALVLNINRQRWRGRVLVASHGRVFVLVRPSDLF